MHGGIVVQPFATMHACAEHVNPPVHAPAAQ
jgi:hypothetical protein